MYCEKCGAEIADSAIFCNKCGEKNKANLSVGSLLSDEIKPKKKKRKIIALISVLIAITVVFSALFGFNRKKDQIEFTEEGVNDFCKDLVKNVRGGSAEIYEQRSRSCVIIKVKLNGYQEEEVWVYFENTNESDKVSHIYFRYTGSEGDNYYNCCIAVAEAIERTVCGKSKVKEFSDIAEVKEFTRTQPMIGGETKIIAEYSLTSNSKSKVYCWGDIWYYYFIFTE